MKKATAASLTDEMLVRAFENFVELIERKADARQKVELMASVNVIALEMNVRRIWDKVNVSK